MAAVISLQLKVECELYVFVHLRQHLWLSRCMCTQHVCSLVFDSVPLQTCLRVSMFEQRQPFAIVVNPPRGNINQKNITR